ncbi:homeobox protein ttx-1-like [Saccoglossus kowalevskii]|uniref:Homeobox protein SEBOX-like n=1 Tax=Saccoglossus kowalevskii TaxID=10224 RepID=A0ABM0MUV9_SACKO|nr:PREDICTED: homeobox protein SEBOX-like [Saccoglossus kowalevskii]
MATKARACTSFTKQQVAIMQEIFNTVTQYPDPIARERIANVTELPENAVVRWFQNRRQSLRSKSATLPSNMTLQNLPDLPTSQALPLIDSIYDRSCVMDDLCKQSSKDYAPSTAPSGETYKYTRNTSNLPTSCYPVPFPNYEYPWLQCHTASRLWSEMTSSSYFNDATSCQRFSRFPAAPSVASRSRLRRFNAHSNTTDKPDLSHLKTNDILYHSDFIDWRDSQLSSTKTQTVYRMPSSVLFTVNLRPPNIIAAYPAFHMFMRNAHVKAQEYL